MRTGSSLRTRFLLATSVLVLLLCGVFGLVVRQFIELLEDEMLHKTLVREMHEFAADVAANRGEPPPASNGLQGYRVRNAEDRQRLPAPLAALSKGVHEDIALDGRMYDVSVDTVGDARLYLALDTERVDRLERDVVSASLLLGLVGLGLAAAVAGILARAVMRPVTALANRVANLDPNGPIGSLSGQFADRELGGIAAAIDSYLERLSRVREREQAFTEDASHELRTPVAVVSSAAELLSEEPGLSRGGQERLLRIQRACSQMQSLIEALLFLARGEAAVAAHRCALDEIVKEGVDLVAPAAAARSVSVLTELSPVIVQGDPTMIASVVNNLLLNAVSFTQDGTVVVRLTMDALTVSDTGVGISPEDLSRIFERRYRGPDSRGLGLGLYLVSRLCERLRWQIEAQSQPHAGTVFRVRFSSPSASPDRV
ncbi:MAG TPA: HAMP domain-containing sensor histidine kinase [Steroidobacteraceae bacterium]|nr:HAMP domain-containing sensor histidine kinase [Steroidobacteraceae bacterium]